MDRRFGATQGLIISLERCYHQSMSTIQEIEHAVSHLPPEDLSRFREWFLQFDAELWDREIEEDVAAGRLDALAEEALSDLRAGRTRSL
ncbi:MAG TPA: hypothetical protein VFE05_07235 [Longimicrobiaceae bacterium]|nr:hypothetical protein [Longimicrobiaceae bacterium]